MPRPRTSTRVRASLVVAYACGLASAVASGACNGVPLVGQAPVGPSPARASSCDGGPCIPHTSPLRHAPLQFEVAGRSFQLPVVEGTVGGVRTLFVIDTGASAHILTGWLARKAKLPLENHGDSGSDHTGRKLVSFRTPSPSFVLDSWGKIPEKETLVIEVPEQIEKLGIGAFLSPQNLDADAVVLDLPRGELREARSLDEEKGRLAEWASLSRPVPRLLPEPVPCRDGSTIGGLAFLVPATFGDQSATLLLDTGAQKTDLLAGSAPGKQLSPRAEAGDPVFSASGKVVTKVLRGTELTVGEVKSRLDVSILPGSAETLCARDGVLGMDVLKSCVMVFASGTVHARCLASDEAR